MNPTWVVTAIMQSLYQSEDIVQIHGCIKKSWQGWVMDTDETITLTAADAIPLGHKIALAAIAEGDTIIKYGNDVGRTIAPVAAGGHVHVQNTKTKRW